MRRLRDRRPAGLFRGGELPRLMTMIVMLCVLAMMMRRASDQNTWRCLTGEPANLDQSVTESGAQHKPRVRYRQASQAGDSIVVKAPEADAELALPIALKALRASAPQDAPTPLSAAASVDVIAHSAVSSEDQTETKTQFALGPAPLAAAAPTNVLAAADETTAAESATQASVAADDPPAATPDPEPESKSQASSQPQPNAAERSAVDGTSVKDSAAKATVEKGTSAADESPTAAPPVSLFRPHLPANPETLLKPGTVPEIPPLEPGPLDEDEEERQEFDHECEAISDRTPLGSEEMFAYWRLLRWAQSQTTDEMLKRARSGVRYNDLIQRPEEFRGELLKVKLHIVQVLREDAPPDIPVDVHHYYQALGWNDASQSWFYFCIFADLPEGMTIGERVYEEGTFVGYFLKTHTYLDGKGTKTKAPILIGRMIYHPTPSIAQSERVDVVVRDCGGVAGAICGPLGLEVLRASQSGPANQGSFAIRRAERRGGRGAQYRRLAGTGRGRKSPKGNKIAR